MFGFLGVPQHKVQALNRLTSIGKHGADAPSPWESAVSAAIPVGQLNLAYVDVVVMRMGLGSTLRTSRHIASEKCAWIRTHYGRGILTTPAWALSWDNKLGG